MKMTLAYLLFAWLGSMASLSEAFSSERTPLPAHLGLSSKEADILFAERFYARATPTEASAWPVMEIYCLINATELEAMGIFHALDYQKDYIPNLLVSRPIKRLSPTEFHTRYELKTPWPLKNSHYVHGTVIGRTPLGLRTDWYMVQSDSAESVKGSAEFIRLGPGLTLMAYKGLIQPKSFFAGVAKKIAFLETQASVRATAAEIEKLKRQHSPLLEKYSSYLERAFKGENVYQIAN